MKNISTRTLSYKAFVSHLLYWCSLLEIRAPFSRDSTSSGGFFADVWQLVLIWPGARLICFGEWFFVGSDGPSLEAQVEWY